LQDAYRKWCKAENFESMLPQDVKDRKTTAALAKENAEQATIDGHLRPIIRKEVIIPYTDSLFREAAIEWLISTNQASVFKLELSLTSLFISVTQPIQAVDHPSFKKMIDIASRATNGVNMPDRKATRHEIMELFKLQMTKLKERLNVCYFKSYSPSAHANAIELEPYSQG
jgi:hypothetical protein